MLLLKTIVLKVTEIFPKTNALRKEEDDKISYVSWRPPSLSELTLIVSNTGLTHLGSEASS